MGSKPIAATAPSAFSGYSPGGNTRTNSARGQQSLEGRIGGGWRSCAARGVVAGAVGRRTPSMTPAGCKLIKIP